jgi:hypothetical protein
MRPDVPYLIILLCLTPDDFTRQEESAATQWVNQWQCALLYYFTLSNASIFYSATPDDFTCQGEGGGSVATQ